MSMFDALDADLGFASDDPKLRLAELLVAEDRDLIEALIALRIHRGLSQTDVANHLNRNKSVVSNFERLGSDPRPSTIRRYAVAVGARIRHVVEDAYDNGLHHSRADGWVVFEISQSNRHVRGRSRTTFTGHVREFAKHASTQEPLWGNTHDFIIRGYVENVRTTEHEPK